MIAEPMTNEGLQGIRGSSFELVHFAIELGRYYIRSGHEASLSEILRDIKKHPYPDYVDQLKALDEVDRKARKRDSSVDE